MRLSCFKYGIDLIFEENKASVLVVENQKVYSDLLHKLLLQINGEEMDWHLSDDEKDLMMNKSVSLLHSPFLLELNTKKNLTYLYKEMRAVSDEYCNEKLGEINSKIVDYLDGISNRLPYSVDFDIDLDATEIFKLYNVHFDYQETSLVEKVINFIQLEKFLCGTKLIIFVNFKGFFDESQMQEIYKTAFYNKMPILLLEAEKRDCLCEEKYCIIDKDKCMILH